jgi:hypothetical protein
MPPETPALTADDTHSPSPIPLVTSLDLTSGRPIADVLKDLNEMIRPALIAAGETGQHNGFHHQWWKSEGEAATKLPASWSWIACYAVRGNSEGYYVHIELICWKTHKVTTLSYMKVWSWDDALNLARACTLAFDNSHTTA